MSLPEPGFKMCEGTIPSVNLYDDCKTEAGDMEVLYGTELSPGKCTEDQERNPQEVDKDSEVCCGFIEHSCSLGPGETRHRAIPYPASEQDG